MAQTFDQQHGCIVSGRSKCVEKESRLHRGNGTVAGAVQKEEGRCSRLYVFDRIGFCSQVGDRKQRRAEEAGFKRVGIGRGGEGEGARVDVEGRHGGAMGVEMEKIDYGIRCGYGVNLAGKYGVLGIGVFERPGAGKRGQGCQVSARRGTPEADPVWIEAVVVGYGANPSNGGFYVLDGGRKDGLVAEAVVNRA